MNLKRKLLVGVVAVAIAGVASAQMMYGNTFPFWNVTGALDVGGATTLRGSVVMSGTTSFTGATAIKGTTTNDSAAAGYVGEVLTTTVAVGDAVAGPSSTASANVTSVSLTAGDWDVSGTCDMIWSGITATVLKCGLGTTTNTLASQAGGSGIGTDPLSIVIGTLGTTVTGTYSLPTPTTRVTLAATTTIYLVNSMTYSAGSVTNYGTIRARRMR